MDRLKMKTLHIIKNRDDSYTKDIVKGIAQKGDEVAILLMHDAVFSRPEKDIKTFACKDDVDARGITSNALPVTYDEIIPLIFEYDNVICW